MLVTPDEKKNITFHILNRAPSEESEISFILEEKEKKRVRESAENLI